VKPGKQWFGIAGLLFAGSGVLLLHAQPYLATTVISTAGGCGMRVDVIGSRTSQAEGFVVLLHGLSANKRIMFYLAESFSNQNLRVFIPDLPGHGASPGPFTYDRAESCSEALVQDLIERRAILPDRTFLVGHSLGGAIALRVASHIPVAGAIAISPAPMRPTPGISPEMLPYPSFGALSFNSLVISGAWEPPPQRTAAKNLVPAQPGISDKYVVIPRATHVSLLFDSDVAAQDRAWVARLLKISSDSPIPPHWSLLGFFLGFAGLAILVVPFLREVTGNPDDPPNPEAFTAPSSWSSFAQVAIVSALAVLALSAGVPLRALRIFQGDYLISFFALTGVALLIWNRRLVGPSFSHRSRPLLASAFAAAALIVLFGAWFNLSLYDAWLTPARWLRLPIVALLFLPWFFAEEILLGPAGLESRWRRYFLSLSFRALVWVALVSALFFLHSGEILLLLLSIYFAMFFVLERLAAALVRRETHSPAAAAIFGAILFAGLALAIFPVA